MSGRRIRTILAITLMVVLAGSVVANAVLWSRSRSARETIAALSRRTVALEKLVAAREAADPLMPWECEFGEGSGTSRETPCRVEFQRLYESPQQFSGRWVAVEGRYLSGMETSALFTSREPVTFKDADRLLRENRALWVDSAPLGGERLREVLLIGKFKRGPAGHLSQYFGRLTDVRVFDDAAQRRLLTP